MVSVSNPVNSVLFLIGIFFNTSIIFILLNVDFLGLLFLMVYVGAIAVLFLFIVMMLNVNRIEKDHSVYLTIGGLLLFFYFLQFFLIIFYHYLIYIPNFFDFEMNWFEFFDLSFLDEFSRYNIVRKIGLIIYKEYFVFIFYVSIILYVAMIGTVYLTNKKKGYSMRRQHNQISRNNYLINVFVS
jgi:NADH:ubiquinone oxidoreductase subunit 6 (subunit J)